MIEKLQNFKPRSFHNLAICTIYLVQICPFDPNLHDNKKAIELTMDLNFESNVVEKVKRHEETCSEIKVKSKIKVTNLLVDILRHFYLLQKGN